MAQINMVSRRRRQFVESDAAVVLAAVARCRDACIDALRKAPPSHDIVPRVQAVMRAIDDVAELITGDRRHFWLKPHGGARDGR